VGAGAVGEVVKPSMRTWTIAQLACLALLSGCAKREDANTLPSCDATEVQAAAREAAAASVKVPFTLSTFSEVASERTDTQRACRVRATHAASGAALWMRFTLARRPVEKGDKKSKEPQDELAIVFAPIE
jgi:hypothetical protein